MLADGENDILDSSLNYRECWCIWCLCLVRGDSEEVSNLVFLMWSMLIQFYHSLEY